MIWPLAKGWLIGYLFAGPRRDPVVEAKIAFMDVWRLTEAIRRLTPTAEEAAVALSRFSVAYRETMDVTADVPTTACQG
jgi:hypothetical protein